MLESLPEGSSDSPWPSGFLGERSCLSWSSVPRGPANQKESSWFEEKSLLIILIIIIRLI